MKRNINLVPFSHDHHQGLIFALRLKKGIAKAAAPDVLKKYILGYWEVDLHHHFFEEERLLLPHLEANHPLTVRFKLDHQSVREAVQAIAELDDERIIGWAEKLSNQIERHIRFEERELFPFMEEEVSQKELRKIGEGLAGHKEVCYAFKPEFWKPTQS